MSVPAEELKRAVEELRAAPEVALACHLGPDGDALGSMLALGIGLRGRGTRVVASWGSEPFSVPKHYAFLPGQDLLVPPEEFPAAPALMVTFDTGAPSRLGTLEPNALAAERLIVIDHHVSNDTYGTVNVVDSDAAASAVLVYALLAELGFELDRDIALCLYTGILTDTGSFKYRNTTPGIHRIVADLLRFDIGHDEVARVVYDTHPFGYLKLASVTLERAEIRPEASLVWTWVSQEDLKRFELGLEDTEAIIDLIRTADTAEVACVMKQGLDGTWKGSLRSKGNVNVGAVAEALGGGGHAFAAGFSADGDPHAAVAAVVDRLMHG